jgi:hypothetical protein
MDTMRDMVEAVIHERWPAAKEAKKRPYDFYVPCAEEGCTERLKVSTLMLLEAAGEPYAMCTEGHKSYVSERLRGSRPAGADLAAQVAEICADVKAISRKQDRGLSLLEAMSGELTQLQALNADAKQCLNFLVGHTTSKLPPRIYQLQPVDFDFNDPKPILGSAVRPRIVRLAIWCEWEDQPVPGAVLDIEVDAPLVHTLKERGAVAVKILATAIAVWSGVGAVHTVLTGEYSGLLDFMHKLGDAAKDITFEIPDFEPGDDGLRGQLRASRIERHRTADELNAMFAVKLREAAEKGSMEQVYCPDGQWRWVSKEAALRLAQTEPRQTISRPTRPAIANKAPD